MTMFDDLRCDLCGAAAPPSNEFTHVELTFYDDADNVSSHSESTSVDVDCPNCGRRSIRLPDTES
jgi:hypothetical protein